MLAVRFYRLDHTTQTGTGTVEARCVEARSCTTCQRGTQGCGSAVNRVAFRHAAKTTQLPDPRRAIPRPVCFGSVLTVNTQHPADAAVDAAVDDDVDIRDGVDLDDVGDDAVEFDVEPVSDPIGTARRRHGAAGAILAAGMFGVDIALGRKVKEEAPIVMAASSEPVDIEKDGIEVPIDENTSVYAPPQPPSDPFPPRRRRKPDSR